MNEVEVSEKEVYELFRDKDGPIGNFLREMADQIAVVARAKVQVRRIPDKYHTGRTSDARRPGYTKLHITTTVGHAVTYNGLLFGGAEAPEDPGLFLELPAEQIADKGHKFPFLSTGLDSLWVG